MKRWIGVILFVGAIALIDHGITQQTDPIALTWITPTNGSVVSGTIDLEVLASSSAAPITKVEFYRDGVLIKTVYNLTPNHPNNLLTKLDK